MPLEKEKLVRQLSLVAFLMSMNRPVTARDVRECVEGYSHMGDDAFARRFYADRTELLGLGVPLKSTRDDDTGEELYTLSSKQYLLPTLDLTDPEVTAIHSYLSLLDGQFAYAEPLRLALQNLTLGRENPITDPAAEFTDMRQMLGEHSPEIAARIAKLETAITKRRTITFNYFTNSRGEEGEKVVDPYTLVWNDGQWYLVGRCHAADEARQYRLSRIRGEIKFTSRRERDFEVPADFDATAYRTNPDWQRSETDAEADLWVDGSVGWWVERTLGHAGEVVERADDGSIVFRMAYATADQDWLVGWMLSMNGLVRPVAPSALVDSAQAVLATIEALHTGPAPKVAGELPPLDMPEAQPRRRKPAAPVGAEQFALLQALMSDLLASCSPKGEGAIPAADLMSRYGVDEKGLKEAVDLLTLVNFGAGAYAMYAELDGDTVRVDAWPEGEVFRRPARLSPLEAKALLMALDLVGPLVAASSCSDLNSVREKLTAAFGGYGSPTVPATTPTASEQHVLEQLTTAMRGRRVLRIEYFTQNRERAVREIEPMGLQAFKQHWMLNAWCQLRDAERSFRLDRIKSIEVLDATFEPRGSIDAVQPEAETARAVTVWFEPSSLARSVREQEPSAMQLVDGATLQHRGARSENALIEEILTYRGQAMVTHPADLRDRIATRAGELRGLLARVPVA
ncbi:MAG: hypothetical protein JWO69_950 [Thermoleophilia bacterium]|nr:hypothetical protein [Thermoleophilia bacterium]